MFVYIYKRVARGWKSFIALFLGVMIATTLFSGTMIGAENVGSGMLEKAMSLVPVDIVVADVLRDLYAVNMSAIEAAIHSLDHVGHTQQMIRWSAYINYIEAYNATHNVDFTIVALEENSPLWRDIFGTGSEGIGIGEVYIAKNSMHAPDIDVGSNVTLWVYTHDPVTMGDYTTFHFNLSVAGFLDLDSRSYMMTMGDFPFFLRMILLGGGEIRLPLHDLLFISRETFFSIFDEVYEKRKLPNMEITVSILVDLERDEIVNPWDVANSIGRIQLISEQIDNKVQHHELHSWQNLLQEVLETVKSFTDNLKMGFVLIALPVFFTAWYMGITVSDVSLSSRRREVGLLLTKGFTRRQIFIMFLVEATLIGLLSGLAGIVVSSLLIPLLGFGSTPLGASFPSPSTVVFALVFSSVISLLSVLMPAWRVSGMNIIDALREYWGAEEEKLPLLWEPAIALILGLYKLLMSFFGVSVESYRPVGGGLLVFVLYSTWWGVDFILGYLGPVLFFWGFTKLFIHGYFHIQEAIGSAVGLLIGELSKISTLSARRTLRRTAAIAFLVALIFGYSVSVIGGLASTDDQLTRVALFNVGADACVWLFSEEGAHELAEEIGALEGVLSTALESWFYMKSAYLSLQLRAIDPEAWGETAYFEEDWFMRGSEAALQSMAESNNSIILCRSLADIAYLGIGDTLTLKIRFKLYADLTIVGLLGPSLMDMADPRPLPSYVSEGFLELYPTLEVVKARIFVRLDPNTDAAEFARRAGAMSENVEVVYTVAEQLEAAKRNIILKGPRQVQELGVLFATLVSSVGVALVVSTTMGERRKEIALMAIRGFSFKQLFLMLVVENISTIAFSILLGGLVGYINIMGKVALSNTASQLILSRIVFHQTSLLFIAAIVAAILFSAVVPIAVAARQTRSELSWRLIE